MSDLPSVIGAVFGGLTTLGGVAVLFIKARNQGALPRQVLRRVVDWIEGVTSPKADLPLMEQMPPRLRADIDRVLEEGDER